MSSPSDDAKYDDGIDEAFDEADEEANHVLLTTLDVASSIGLSRRFTSGRDFYASPRSLEEIEYPERTPL